jgi:hypothetical protein
VERETFQTFALLGGCYGLFVVTTHELAVKVIKSLLVVLLVVQISQISSPLVLFAPICTIVV